jgi:hypothetical protein
MTVGEEVEEEVAKGLVKKDLGQLLVDYGYRYQKSLMMRE